MTESNDPIDLLSSATPVLPFEIDDVRLTQMINRVVASPVRQSLLRTWWLRATSAGIGVVIVVMGVVIALVGTGGLPVLELSSSSINLTAKGFAATQKSSAASPVVKAFAGAMTTSTQATSFKAGSGLSSRTFDALVYDVIGTQSPGSTIIRVAKALGMANPKFKSVSNCSVVTDHGAHVDSILLTGTVPNCHSPSRPIYWTYTSSRASCRSVGEASACVQRGGATNSQIRLWAAPLATRLAPRGVSLGSPSLDRTRNEITYPLLIHGVLLLGGAMQFRFTNVGQLVQASGIEGAVVRGTRYPITSAVGGVSLVRDVDRVHAPTHTISASTLNRSTNKGSTVLQAATLDYAMSGTTNGSLLLLPTYLYHATDGSTWELLALQRSFVRWASTK